MRCLQVKNLPERMEQQLRAEDSQRKADQTVQGQLAKGELTH